MTDRSLTKQEHTQAIELANRLLDEPNCDPDDDLRVLSRQLLRRHEELDSMKRKFGEHPSDGKGLERISKRLKDEAPLSSNQCPYCGYEDGKHNAVCIAAELQRVYGLVNHWAAEEKRLRAALNAVRAKLAEYLERLLQGRTLPNRWVGEINDIVGAAFPGDSSVVETSGADYEEVLADHRRLVRELDVALNGDGAAQQASLCDIVGQVKDRRWKLVRADETRAERPILATELRCIHAVLFTEPCAACESQSVHGATREISFMPDGVITRVTTREPLTQETTKDPRCTCPPKGGCQIHAVPLEPLGSQYDGAKSMGPGNK